MRKYSNANAQKVCHGSFARNDKTIYHTQSAISDQIIVRLVEDERDNDIIDFYIFLLEIQCKSVFYYHARTTQTNTRKKI